MVLVQSVLIILILALGFSVLSQLYKHSGPQTDALTLSTTCVAAERRLLDIFLFQRRSAERFLILRDHVFLEHFLQGNTEFTNALEKVASLIETPEEQALLGQIRTLYARYSDGVTASGAQLESWKHERAAMSDRIIAALQELIHLGEARMAAGAPATRPSPVSALPLLGWLLAIGVGLIIVLLYWNARWISDPLRQLAREMQHVSQGDFRRSVRVSGPREVAETMQAFNRMTERLAELDEMQGDFLAQMSHELRTPLTAIQEGSALLLEEVPGVLNAAQREIVQVVRSNSDRLFRRLASILDLSKMEARKMEYLFVPTDLVAVARHSVEAIGPSAQKKQLQVTLHTPAPLPVLYVDEERIRQVLDNLLSNAVKFTPEKGKIRVSTSVRYEAESGQRWVEVNVSDTGPGVPPEDAERIFHKFYQSSASRRQAWRGSGLGLAISRHIVEAHGGRIWVESRPGEGASFTFTLPVRSAANNWQKRNGRTQRSGGPHAG